MLLGAPGHTTRSKKLLGARGIATRNKDACDTSRSRLASVSGKQPPGCLLLHVAAKVYSYL